MKKFFALLLVLCMIFALAACGGKNAVGTWQGKVNLAEVAGAELGELKDYMKDANVDFILELKSDNTFTLQMDGTALMPILKDAFRAYLDDMLSSMGMTAADYEAAAGQSVDALIDSALAEMNTDDLNKSISGTYTDDGGKLVLTPNDGSAPVNGSWEKDALTLHDDDIGDIAFTRK